MIWVHGFENNAAQAKEGFSAVEARYKAAGGKCVVYGFSWPADTGAVEFRVAEITADVIARNAFADFIRDLTRACPKTCLNLFGHSLGARVILHALQKSTKFERVDKVFLIEAAVSYISLGKGGEFEDAHKFAGDIFVAHSASDRVLNSAWVTEKKGGAALGSKGPWRPNELPSNIHAKDFEASFRSDHSAVYDANKGAAFWKFAVPELSGQKTCPEGEN